MAWWIVFPEARRVGPFPTSWDAARGLAREEVRTLVACHAGSPLIRFLSEEASGGVATLERPPAAPPSPPPPPLTSRQFDQQYPRRQPRESLEEQRRRVQQGLPPERRQQMQRFAQRAAGQLDGPTPRRTRPLVPPEQQTRPPAAPAPAPAPPAAAAKRWTLPLHQHPPLVPDNNSAIGRLPLQTWVERGVAPDWLPASTVSAAYVRLFGIGPPRETFRTGSRSSRGYTRRELEILLTALRLNPAP